ncbi:MAG TPA: DHA2 family efflux MFS transporter permease subunit [Streptosporangiaceae bacterium]
MEGTRSWPVFAVTALGAFVASLDVSIVNIAFPSVRASFPDVTEAGLAWIITAYGIVFGALLVTAGRLSDRYGRRRVFVTGLAVFGAASALCGLAPSLPVLVAGRAVQAVGSACVLPSSLGLLLAAYPAARRSQVVAFWSGVGALAIATGPSLGAVIVQGLGWRGVFYVNLPVCALAIAGVRPALRASGLADDRTDAAGRGDPLGVVLLIAGLSALVLAISQGNDWGWSDPRLLAALAAAAVLLAAFVVRAHRRTDTVLDLTLFRERAFSAANSAMIVFNVGFFAMLLGNILFLTGVWHWTTLAAGLAVTPGPIVVALVSGQAGRVAARIGFRPVLLVGAAFFVGGMAWYRFKVGPEPDFLGAWLPGALLSAVGIALTVPVLAAGAVSTLPPHRFGVGSAVNQTARQVGGAIGVAVLVTVLGPAASLRGFQHVWVVIAVCALASACLSALIGARRTAEVTGPVPAR